MSAVSIKRRSVIGMVLAAGVGACDYGYRGYYKLAPDRQYRLVIEERAHDALLRFVEAFARRHDFSVFRTAHRSAPSAPSIFWTLEQRAGMIVFQNIIVGEEPDPANPDNGLDRHSRTEFSTMFYRSMFGYSDEELEQLIASFGSELTAVDGLLEFVDQFPRASP